MMNKKFRCRNYWKTSVNNNRFFDAGTAQKIKHINLVINKETRTFAVAKN